MQRRKMRSARSAAAVALSRALAERLAPLLAEPGRAQVAARPTVTGDALDLATRLSAVYALGFSEAGVAPLRTAKDDANVDGDGWPGIPRRTHCGRSERTCPCAQRPTIRLTNLAVALKQIHAGASSPYPCGAGGGYFSVAADGRWYACHRAIGDARLRLGRQREPRVAPSTALPHRASRACAAACNTCWARYLCSGGCHQEAGARTEAGLRFYPRLADLLPRRLLRARHRAPGLLRRVVLSPRDAEMSGSNSAKLSPATSPQSAASAIEVASPR